MSCLGSSIEYKRTFSILNIKYIVFYSNIYLYIIILNWIWLKSKSMVAMLWKWLLEKTMHLVFWIVWKVFCNTVNVGFELSLKVSAVLEIMGDSPKRSVWHVTETLCSLWTDVTASARCCPALLCVTALERRFSRSHCSAAACGWLQERSLSLLFIHTGSCLYSPLPLI